MSLISQPAYTHNGKLYVNGRAIAGTVPANHELLDQLIHTSDNIRRWLITPKAQ